MNCIVISAFIGMTVANLLTRKFCKPIGWDEFWQTETGVIQMAIGVLFILFLKNHGW
jgi:hypothetical protein